MARPHYKAERPKSEVYGFLLTIRCVAAFAVRWPEYPATLRVLAVLAEYMNQDGWCRVSRFTLADRLGMTRQAVQHHLKSLRDKSILSFESGNGATTRFEWDDDHASGARREREGQDEVEHGRQERRAERKAKRKTSRPPKPQVQANGLAPVPDVVPLAVDVASIAGDVAAGASSDLAPPASSDLAAGASSDLAGGASPLACTKKPSFRTSKDSSEREGAGAPASPCGSPGAAPQVARHQFCAGDWIRHPTRGHGEVVAMLEGGMPLVRFGNGEEIGFCPDDLKPDRVYHSKFGHGTVTCRDGDNGLVTVDFDRAGRKRVVPSFLAPAA